jgi:ABC-type antimicrobial peptide transport system permease subunit
MAGFAVVALFVALACLAPLVSPYDPLATDWLQVRKAPSATHWFGTDEIGRDVLARIIWAAPRSSPGSSRYRSPWQSGCRSVWSRAMPAASSTAR